MDTQQMLTMLPDLHPEELVLIQNLTKDLPDSQQRMFFNLYRGKRKEKRDLMILTLIGFFGVAGLQRFVTRQIGMGILYLFTFGFCGIGTIVDLIYLDDMASEYNQKQAVETVNLVRMITP